jgi:hypothetical protein
MHHFFHFLVTGEIAASQSVFERTKRMREGTRSGIYGGFFNTKFNGVDESERTSINL